MLLFKKKFLDDIRCGRKTQTIRVWKVRHMRSGQLSYIPGVGYIRIDAVDKVALHELTDEDALPDGFSSATELRQEIQRLYNEQQLNDHQVFRIRFHVLPADEQRRLKEERRQRVKIRQQVQD
jgi:hypothetical protein